MSDTSARSFGDGGDVVAYWLYRHDEEIRGNSLSVSEQRVHDADIVLVWSPPRGLCGYAQTVTTRLMNGQRFFTYVPASVEASYALGAFKDLVPLFTNIIDEHFEMLPDAIGSALLTFIRSGGRIGPTGTAYNFTLDNSTLSGEDVLSGKSDVPPPPPKSPADALTEACDAIAPPASRGLRYLLRAAAFLGDQKTSNPGIVSPATLLFTIADAVEQSLPLNESAEERRFMTVLAQAATLADGYADARDKSAPRQRLPGPTDNFPLRHFQFSSGAKQLLLSAGRRAERRGTPETTIEDVVATMVETSSGRLGQLKKSFHLDEAALRAALDMTSAEENRPLSQLPRTHPDAIGEDNQDLLDVSADVETFARFVAARTTHLPLAIGVFGDWGHGKSFFMKAIKARVRDLSQQAKDTSPFHAHIAQIEFNAWHYVEADLWASLADHLFTGLDRHFKSKDEGISNEEILAQNLLNELESAKTVATETERLKKSAETELKAAQSRLKDAQLDYATALKQDGLRIDWPKAGHVLMRTVLDTPELQKAWRDLGLPAEIDSKERLRECLSDLTQTTHSTKAAWKTLFAGEGWNRPNLWLTAALLAVPTLVALAVDIPFGEDEETLFTWLDGIKAGVAFVLAQGAWLYQNAKTSLAKLVAAQERVATAVDSTRQESLDAKARAEADVLAKTAALESANKACSDADQKVALLQQQIKESTPQERMRRFLAERVADGTYAAKLGIVATIRKDIEKLSDLLAPTDKAPDPDLPRLDRIILYIDDLDRCPAPLVVKVLQAIHLLLAFPLFVVVVAVDVRWLMASLKDAYSHLLTDGEADKTQKVPDDRHASTHDYLEKIFQIPYWVQPMGENAANTYARRLLEASVPSPAMPPQDKEQGQDDASTGTAATTTDTASTGADTTQEQTAQKATTDEAEQQMELASLNQDEIEDIATMAPFLGGSPRRVKRFINLYSLIKVGLADRAQILSAPERRALLTNLVVAAGAPRLAPAYFRALAVGTDLNNVIANVDGHKEADADIGWRNAKRALNSAFELADLRDWAPLAHRYSFTSEPPDVGDFTPPPSSPTTA